MWTGTRTPRDLMPKKVATRSSKGSAAAAESAEADSEETASAPEGVEEEIVEEELEVSGGTLEVSQLAAAQAAQAKAEQSATAAAEQVKTAKAAQDAAAACLAAAKTQEKVAIDKAVQYDKWVSYVEDDANAGEEGTLARYWKLIEREDKKRDKVELAARELKLDALRRADVVRQDKRDAAQSEQINSLRKEIDVLRNGEKPNEEPAFRDFAARAPDNQYGELRQNDPLKVFQNEPKLQTYDTLAGAGRDVCYDRSSQGRSQPQIARHTNLTKDLSVAESLVDAVAELVKAVPELEAIFKGESDPASELAEESDEYIALSAISRCYNTLRAVHDNILQPSINYHQVWPIVSDFVAVKSNGLKDTDAIKIMSSLEGPIAGKAFGGQTLPKNLSDAWTTAISGMESKSSDKMLKNLAAARDSSPRTPFARTESPGGIGSTYGSRRRSEAYSDRSPAPRG